MATNTRIPGTIIRSGSIPTTALTGGVVSSSVQVTTLLPGGSVSSSAQVTALLPIGVVSSSAQYPGWVTASSQIDYNSITNKLSDVVSSSAQVQPLLPNGTVSASSQYPGWVTGSSQIDITQTTNYTTFSSSVATVDTTQTNRLNSLENVTGSYATTGSNIFVGTQSFNDTTNTTSYLDGAIHVAGGMSVRQDFRVSGSVTINGLLTAVSMSTQYVTSSQYNVGVSKITLNDDDTVRFAGISIYDSGSSSPTSASIYWDSLQHRFIYENLSGSSYNSSIIIAGPKHTGSLGDESTLTSGYVPYATGTDHIDNSVIYQSGSNIGIGTTSVTSGYKLDVRGLIYSYVASGNTGFVAQAGTNANAALNAVEGFGLELNTDATNRNLRFSSNNTVLMTILGGGNVGIGATNPTQKLHISGSSTVVSLLESSGTYAISRLKNSTLQADIGVDTTGLYMDTVGGTYPIVFYINGSERMRISGSGNVGIGTTDLGAKLHLLDTTQNLINVEIHSSGLSSQNWINLDRALAGKTTISEGALTGRIAFRGYDGTNYITAALISSATDAAVGTNDMPGRLMFSTTADGASSVTERMRITSAGNIGIGTTSPNLSAGAAGSTYLTLSTSTTGRNSVLELNGARTDNGGYTGYVRFFNNLAASPLADIQAIRAGADTSGSLAFATTNVERMRIDSSGNVGIGTSPAVTLDVGTYGTNAVYATGRAVDGSVAFFSSVATLGGIRINTEAYGSATSAYLDLVNIQSKDLAIPSGFRIIGGVGAGAGANNAYLAFSRFQMNGNGTVTASEYIRVDTSGNVGIGTNGPKNKLHVNGSVQVGFVDAINDALVLSWNGASSYGSIQTFSSSHLALNPSGNNVGIGTTNPSARLNIAHPNHGVAIDAISSYYGSVGGIFSSAASSTYPFNVYGNIIIATRPDFGGFYDIVFTTAASNNTPVERMVVKSSGNVGIGITNPAEKLELRSGYFRMSDPSSNAGAGYDIQWSSNNGGTNAVYASIVAITTVSGARTGELRFYTSNAGAPTQRLTIGSTGNVVPGANGTQDLGSSSLRWSTVYTSDLSLSNGIGDWTIVEGEDDLFIYNNKNNKVYKFTLQEVDPSTATPKKS